MSSNDRLIETIEHYKRNISRACPENEQLTDPKKVVYCLEKLSKLPISVQLLSVTGIGRTVNELRKFEGPISEKAKILVTTWKAVVKAEEDKKPAEVRPCASDVDDCEDIREVNGNHQDAESSASENEDNTSEEDEDKEDLRHIGHADNENTEQSDDEDLDKENEREEESEEESEDERQRRLKFEEEKKAYEEYLKAKRKKALNGHVKNGENEKRNGEKRKSEEKREHKKPDDRWNGKEDSKDKQRSDKEKHRSSSDNKSSRDYHEKKNGERSRSRDNHQDSKHSSKSNGKDSQSSSKDSQANGKSSISSSKDNKSSSKDNKSNSTEKYSKEIQIKKEKIDDGYEKALEKQNCDKSSDRRKESDRRESDKKDKHKNGESRERSSKDDRHSKSGRDKSKNSSSSKHREDKARDQSKRKHDREASESGGKRSKAEVEVKREPVSSDEDSRSSSARGESSSRESSVSAGARSVKKEKTESSSQKEKHISRDRGHAGGGSEPKKIKLVEAKDGGFADALMSIEPTKKSPKKKSSFRKASEQEASPAAKSSRSSSPRNRSTTRSPSVHSSGSISPLDLLSGNVKLEPLEKLDIASTLPEISPDNYFKPHLYQSPSDKAASQAAAHNDLCNIMTSKNQRTKVFSGSRVTLTKVPSLYDSCIRILQENIDSLEYTGGVPYDILKPILERCSAEQLYQLEHYNPYLMEDTGSLWQFHCGRDFRGKKLQEYETWRELYLRCMLEREKKLKEVRSKVSLSKKQSVPVRTTKLAYVDSSFVKPPRQVARQQARHGTGGSGSGLTVSNPNKAEVVAKATVGAYSSSAVLGGGAAVPVAPVKPGNSGVSAGAANPLMKKKKAPLMMKALQSFKGIRKR